MGFKSQICTTIEQSKRLLDMGLKRETADMKWIPYTNYVVPINYDSFIGYPEKCCTPAWSLHRLMEIGDFINVGFLNIDKMFDCCIQMLEGQIRCGSINQDYIIA